MEHSVVDYKSDFFQDLKQLIDDTYQTDISQEIIESVYTAGNRQILVSIDSQNKVVGCAFLEERIDLIRKDHDLFVTYVAVDLSVRKQGIGKKLFEYIEKIAKQKGCRSIELTSANHRVEAHAFYSAIGFTVKKTTVFIKEIDSDS